LRGLPVRRQLGRCGFPDGGRGGVGLLVSRPEQGGPGREEDKGGSDQGEAQSLRVGGIDVGDAAGAEQDHGRPTGGWGRPVP